MRGVETKQATMLTLTGPDQRVPNDHPLRRIKVLADAALESLSNDFDAMYSAVGRPSIAPERLLLIDDLLATGGTAEAAVKLLRSLGAEVLAACFVIDLPDLGGRQRLEKLGVPVSTLVSFAGH